MPSGPRSPPASSCPWQPTSRRRRRWPGRRSWPPVALLLAVELVGHERKRDYVDLAERDKETKPGAEVKPEKMITLADSRLSRRTAEQVMWDHYQSKLAEGLPPPTGAELDEVARTNNYDRAVLRKWRRKGRTDPPSISVVR
jgi:hypothetical protein